MAMQHKLPMDTVVKHERAPSLSFVQDLSIQDETPDEQSSLSEAVPSPKKNYRFFLTFICLGLAVFVVSWDATSLGVAISVIAEDLGATTIESFWANAIFMLGVTITQPIYASVSDIFGRKSPFYVAMVVFTGGCIMFSVAEDMNTLILGRLLQGLGGGGLEVLAVMMVSDITSLKERPLYLGLMAVPMASGSLLGLMGGGLLVELVSWRWIGWINLPFIGVAFPLAYVFLRLQPINTPLREKIRQVDWIGIGAFTVGATAVALPLSWADSIYPWSSWRTILPLIVGILALVGFGAYERRATFPMLPYRIFKTITASMALLGGFIHGIIMYAVLFYLPLFFQAVLLEEPLQSAISCLPVLCVTVGFSFISPITVQMIRRYRLLLWAGWIFTTLCLGLYCLIDETSPRAQIIGIQIGLGFGIGTVFTVTAIPLQASIEDVNDTGLAAGFLLSFRLFGALIGLAICSAAFINVFTESIAAIRPLPQSLQVLEDASQALSILPALRNLDLPRGVMERVIGAYREPFRVIWIILSAFSGLGLLVSLFVKELSIENKHLGRQRFEPSHN